MSEQDTSTYYDRSEFLAAAKAPEYATSARYREEVSGKLARSTAAGTITSMGQSISRDDTVHTRTVHNQPEGQALFGNGVGHALGAEPSWAEASKVSQGCFDSPEAIARAMAAPQFDIDPSYKQAVRNKIDRSIREGYLTADLKAADPAQRYVK
jgi:hypothetical protein